MSGHNNGAVQEGRVTTRGTSNSNQRGSTLTRRRRREWLVETYRADRDALVLNADPTHTITLPVPLNTSAPACRCYRCGRLLTVDTVTVDRIIPGVRGGTYRRDNIRPACGDCNSETGGALARKRKRRA